MKSIVENEGGTYTIDGKLYVEGNSTTLSAESPTKEEVFAELVKDLVRKEDREKYPNSVFWLNKDGRECFRYDEKTKYFWCSPDLIWLIFETKFGMNYDAIENFTKGMVEKHFKCKDITTYSRLTKIAR